MLLELADFENVFGPFRLFRYLSVRCVLACVLSFITAVSLAPAIIRQLRRIKFGDTMRGSTEVGALAELTKEKKGTPAMGGLIIFVGVIVSVFLLAKFNALVVTAMIVYVGLTLLGFADDYLKILKKSSDGVSGTMKMFIQFIISIIAFMVLIYFSPYAEAMRELWAPFMKTPLIATMPLWFTFAFLLCMIVSSSNAVNLTDGVDGLAIGCTVSVALAYAVFAYVTGNSIASEYLFIKMIPDCGELTVVCCALLGASMAFLWYNAYPADVWMGDTGSLAIGGLIGVIAFMVHQPFTLIIVGGIFVMEAGSVILQVGSYKTRKKRIFRMSPIHHHYQLKGWKETRVVIRFWIVSLIFALIGLATLKLR